MEDSVEPSTPGSVGAGDSPDSTPLFQAEVVTALCGGDARQAERRFGWGRETIEKGLHERHHGFSLPGGLRRGWSTARSEDKDPQLAPESILAIVEPHTPADP